MIETRRIFIPIPKPKNAHVSILINNTEVKSNVSRADFRRPTQILGLGSFIINLKNSNGQLSNLFSKDQIVIFKADNSDGTTRKFQGRIDVSKEVMNEKGQFLEIKGRHKSFRLSEIRVNHASSGDPANILKELIDKYAPEFTYANIQLSGLTTVVEWDYVPFLDAWKQLCQDGLSDSYIDDDLDFHYFTENSVVNEDEAIVEGDNFLSTPGFGEDDFREKNVVTVVGRDDDGMPIIYTDPPDLADSTNVREVYLNDSSLNTRDKCKVRAEAERTNLTDLPKKGEYKSYYLETLNPGENLLIAIMRQKTYGFFKAVEVIDKFGSEEGGLRTITRFEREEETTELLIKERKETEVSLQTSLNPNKMQHSYNFPFDNQDNTSSLTNAEIVDGALKISTGNQGIMISNVRSADKNVGEAYLLYNGRDLGASTFQFSADGGNNFSDISLKQLISLSSSGKSIIVRVVLNSNTANPEPRLDSAVFMYT